jgi:hypothetical protein
MLAFIWLNIEPSVKGLNRAFIVYRTTGLLLINTEAHFHVLSDLNNEICPKKMLTTITDL